MRIKNTESKFGLLAVLLHWTIALGTFGLFGLGLWMRDLSYYDSWYQKGPTLHEGVGVILFFIILFRIVWRQISPPPVAESHHKWWEKLAAKVAHTLLNILLLIIAVSGYLIVTAKGDDLSVFGWFNLPASITKMSVQADLAGAVHFYLAWAVVVLAVLHALAAIKHHIIDKDRTLKRILGL